MGLLKRSGPSATKGAVGKYARVIVKRKRNRAICSSDCEVGERVKMSEPHPGERGIRAKAWRGKGGLHSEEKGVPRGRRQARKASLEEVEGSMSG